MKKLEMVREVNRDEFEDRIQKEKSTQIRKRLRALRQVFDGHSAYATAFHFRMSPSSLERTGHRFNEEGWEGLEDKYRGRAPQMTAEEEDPFRDRILQGPTEADGIRGFHGKDADRILRDEFGVKVHFRTTDKILPRIGLSSLAPRPRNPKSNEKTQRVFKKTLFAG